MKAVETMRRRARRVCFMPITMKWADHGGWTPGVFPPTTGLLSAPHTTSTEGTGYGCSLPGLAGFTGTPPPDGTELHGELPAVVWGSGGRPAVSAPA